MTRPSRAQQRPEKGWHTTVMNTLKLFGWETCHTYPLRTEHGWRTGTTAKGWPDIVALRGMWLLAIEVKGESTPFGPGQIDWLQRFFVLPCARTWVLRPQDDFGEIVTWIRYPAEAPRIHGWSLPPRQLPGYSQTP